MKNRAFLRLRDRNQITLPADVVAQFGLEVGDLLELTLSGVKAVQLRPAHIVTAGTVEADLREKESAERMRRKENRAYASPEEFHRHLDQIEKAEVIESAPEDKPTETPITFKPDEWKQRVLSAVEAALDNASANYIK